MDPFKEKNWKKEDFINKAVIDEAGIMMGYVKDVTFTHEEERVGGLKGVLFRKEKEKSEVNLIVVKDPRVLDPIVVGVIPIELVNAVGDVVLLKTYFKATPLQSINQKTMPEQ
jgi:sporulation protein YlmC with PRC-barrel domain